MAHKKGAASTKNGRDSNSQRLGVKRYGGQLVKAGEIIVPHRGPHFRPGRSAGRGTTNTTPPLASGVGPGSDDPRFAMVGWHVELGSKRGRRVVNIVPAAD